MSTVNVTCVDQTLTITNSPVIASGGENEDQIQFNFCSLWDGYAKVCVFYKNKGELYYSLIDANDACHIPTEMLTEAGRVYFGVVGKSGSTTRTSEVIRYAIREGSIISDAPSQSLADQILAAANNAVTTANAAAADFEDLEESVTAALAAQDAAIAQMGVTGMNDRLTALETAVPLKMAIADYDSDDTVKDAGGIVDYVSAQISSAITSALGGSY